MAKTNPMYKDTVFRMLFKEPKEALSLYNALNGTKYDDPTKLEIVTLENAIYLNMKNDVAIMIDSTLNLYEHQSTPNPNMPLRDLYYVSGELQRLFPAKNLYGRTKKAIPVPRFVVFYNGEEAQAEKFSYRLSDLYAKQVSDPELELIVTVYNINEGMNEDLKNACRSLKEYMQFVAVVNQYRKIMPLQEAIEKAVKDCMTQDILKEFLENNRNQVVSTTLEEFDQELYEKIIRDEGRDEGRQEEREKWEGLLSEKDAKIEQLEMLLEKSRNPEISTTLEEFDQELYEKIIRDEGIEEGRRLERENTEKEKQRANAAEKEIERLKALLKEK